MNQFGAVPTREVRPKRDTCESALRKAGISEALIAKKLREQLEAKQPRWNPKKKAFELFADNDARLAALREAIKIFGGYPSADIEAGLDAGVTIDLGMLTPKEFRERDRKLTAAGFGP